MTCPRCGAYSPYNTAQCNRCGAKLLGEGTGEGGKRGRTRRYYRNARKSDWEKKRDSLLTQANDAVDGIMADKTKRIIFLAALGLAVVLLLSSVIGCLSCVCSGCGDSEAGVSQTDAVVSGGALPYEPPADLQAQTSAGDSIGGEYIVTPSDGDTAPPS